MKIIFYYYIPFFFSFLFKVNIREITPLKKEKGIPHYKGSGLDCTCANTDYFIARF